jgi:hypothetical protein
MKLEMDQAVDAIALRKPRHSGFLVTLNAIGEIRRNTGVERAVFPVGKNIDTGE